MSGIYGVFRYDGAPVDPQWLEQMRSAMAYYGPDGGGSSIHEAVGMGHLLLEVNPEDKFEKQPLRGERGVLICTARLDNRDALLETFKISPSDARQLSDGHLVSLAFDRWGKELCSHLEGDWALAAWEQRERRLILARDVFGLHALYYYQGKGFIAFASSLKALLALPGTTREPELLRLAQILVSWQNDAELTAFKGFRSLIGAHALQVSADGRTSERQFWSPEGREPLRYRRDEDYVEAFLDCYNRAVKSCLRTRKPVAAELSGGRDSGSVVALAAPLLEEQGRGLTAFTSVPWLSPDGASSDRLGDEWDLAHATAVMAGRNVTHVPIDARECGVIEGIEHFLDIHDGPSRGNQYWGKAIMEACARSGAGVVLSGQMGNGTVSWSGNGSAALALLKGEHATALRLLLHGEPNPWLLLKRQILKPLLTPGRRFIRRLRTPLRSPWQSYSALNPQLAKELDLNGRMQKAGHDPTFTVSPLQDRRSRFFRANSGTDISIVPELSAWYSLARLDPTANLRMVEFLLRVPDDQFYRRGRHSFLIQRALQNRLPEPVLCGKRRGLQAADVGHRIVRELAGFQECLASLKSVPEAREVLDLPLLDKCLADLVAKVTPETTARAGAILLRGIGVGLFLQRLNVGSWNSHYACATPRSISLSV